MVAERRFECRVCPLAGKNRWAERGVHPSGALLGLAVARCHSLNRPLPIFRCAAAAGTVSLNQGLVRAG